MTEDGPADRAGTSVSVPVPAAAVDVGAAASVALVEVTRERIGAPPLVESVHHGHLVVASGRPGDGPTTTLALGTPDVVVYPRSAVKPFQATGCLELLDEQRPDLSVPDDELAVGWASHRGERRHLDAVLRLLARSGTDPEDLTCPRALPEADRVWPPASPGEPPSRLRFNCSGKHALFALAGATVGTAGPALVDPDGPLQRRLLALLDETVGPVAGVGVDGCGAPAVAVPLVGLARGYRSLAVDDRWARVRAAGFAHPGLVGGVGRLESSLLAAGVVAKVGAEGVYGAGWVGEDGVAHGIAVKAGDGDERGAGVALLSVVAALGAVPADLWRPDPPTGGGEPVGVVRPARPVRDASVRLADGRAVPVAPHRPGAR